MSAVIQQTAIDLPYQSATTDERAPRWGFLAGGPSELVLEGVGRMYVGHGSLARRELIPFMPLVVGGRNESQALLEQDYRLPAYNAVFDAEPGGPGRFSTLPNVTDHKWPLESVQNVESTYKVMGFGVLESLTGLDSAESLYTVESGKVRTLFDKSEAARRFNTLLPDLGKRDKNNFLLIGTLIDFINYLRDVQGRAQQEGLTNLWDELSAAANRCRTYYGDFIRKRKAEFESAHQNKGGRANLDDVEIEIFRELHEPLPEERAAIQNAHMGREIAEGLAANAGGSNDQLAQAVVQLAVSTEQAIKQGQQNAEMLARLLAKKQGGRPAVNKGE